MKNNKGFILSVDQSTSGTKSMVVDSQGKVLATAQAPHRQFYPKPGWLEHDPQELYCNVKKTLKKAVLSSGLDPSNISALSITNQRETVLLWNKKTGNPVYNAIVWQCRRTAEICEELKKQGWEETIRDRTGLLLDPYFSASKIKWILDNIILRKNRENTPLEDILAGTVDSWIIWKLTRGKVHATDYTNASRTLLYNIKKLDWDSQLLEIFGVPRHILPQVKSCDDFYGLTSPGELFEGQIPIRGVMGDSQAALFGQCCFKPGMIKTTFGTGSSLMMLTGTKLFDPGKGTVASIAWGIKGKVEYALEGIIHSTGDTLSWLKDNLHLARSFADMDKAASTLDHNDGVYLVPAFFGLGIPYWDPGARAAIIGLSRNSNRSHIIRAAIESSAYQVKDAIDMISGQTGLNPLELRADGGMAKSNFFMQFLAGMLGIKVINTTVADLSLMGVAYMAGLSAGIWENLESVEKLWKIKNIYQPGIGPEEKRKLYDGWKDSVKRVLTSHT